MKLCGSPGCGRTVQDGVRFCHDHVPGSTTGPRQHKPAGVDGVRVHSNEYDEALDKLRKLPRWQTIRARVASRQPFCKRCDTRVTEIVDHIVPARVAIAQAKASGKYPYDANAGYFLEGNLQGLCRSCHAVKTQEDKAHVGPWPDVMEMEAARPKKVYSF
jgi:5-methylcytosine-specific restriction endonuclease McrA